MMLNSLFDSNSDIFTWVILPILIFLSRIADQSFGTLRLIFLSKGYKYIAPMLGFFEVTIWLIAVSQIMKHLDNVFCYLAYGSGFAMGNFIGMTLEEHISIGNVLVRIIPNTDTTQLINKLREQNFGITTIDAEGSKGNVKIVISIIKRKDLHHFVSVINCCNPNAFYTIEEVKTINHGIFRDNMRTSVFDTFGKRYRNTK